jgi:hypothetical protein
MERLGEFLTRPRSMREAPLIASDRAGSTELTSAQIDELSL